MEFKEIELDHKEHLMFRSVTTCGRIEIGVYPVIFGYRVRAGFVGDMWCEIDYCCGDKQDNVEILYSYCKNILEQHEVSHDVFTIFPYQEYKPFFTDVENFIKLITLTNDQVKEIFLPNLFQARLEYLNTFLYNSKD